MPHYPDEIEYSDKYQDDHYEYRHVLLPRDTYKKMPRTRLLNENVISYFTSGMEKLRSPAIKRVGPLRTSQARTTHFVVQKTKGD
jgi:hypothetical protein